MQTFLMRWLGKLFPVQRHEWPKTLMLLSIATLLGVGFSVSRAASEALFLVHFGVEYLPFLLLVNPLLVLVSSTVYGIYADRIPDARLMIYTSVLPVPLILLLRVCMVWGMHWVYFVLYAFVLAYATILTTSWTVYLAGHYDVQESKRLVPFISSGILIGTVMGGLGVALLVPQVGTENMLILWVATLGVGVALVHSVSTLFTAMDTKARKNKRAAPKPSLRQSVLEGIAYSRSSALFKTTALASIATMMAIQVIDFEYSKSIRQAFPNSAQLTAFLGVFDGLTTVLALLLQWFAVPWYLRRFGVQGTNVLFPYALLFAFGLITTALGLPPLLLPAAMFARFTRSSLMPTLRGTARTLMLNAVPRKTGALVRSFNTAMVMPLGQGAGALLLMVLKGLALPWLFPVLGILITLAFLYYSYKQNAAYGEALLDLLKEDRIHLLDLDDEDMRQFDSTAVAAISTRLRSDQEDVCLAAIELLRTIGNASARDALRQSLPYPFPQATAAALQALASIGGHEIADVLRPYLRDAEPQVRMAALAGLRQLGATVTPEQVERLLADDEEQVRAAALVLVLTNSQHPQYARAYQQWLEMFDTPAPRAQLAALSIVADIPDAAAHGRVYRALDHPEVEVRHAALRVLRRLAVTGRVTGLDSALLRALEADDGESRDLALQVLEALGTDEALEHMLILLDDDQPQVRATLINALKGYGRRVVGPLFQRLRAPQTSLTAKESALLALARLDGVQAQQFLEFWEMELRDVYRYKLMLAALTAGPGLDTDAFLRAALENAYRQILSLLVQLVAVWASPAVARLVENGLHDADRHKRANALEALESFSDRRFTRLFLPILMADEHAPEEWHAVAQRQWHLTILDVPELLDVSLKDSNKWVVIGAMLAAQARMADRAAEWSQTLAHIRGTATDPDIQRTAQALLERTPSAAQHTLSLTDTILFLKRIPLYSSLTLEQLRTIASYMTERDMQPGDVIFHQGDHSYELYLIVSGKVDIVQHGEETTTTLVTLAAGDFFGDMAIFENRPRTADAVAVEAGLLFRLSPEHFRDIIMQDPAISFEIFRALSARLRRFDAEVRVTS